MQKILIGTQNKAKLKELTLGLQELKTNKIEILSLADLDLNNDPDETGKTFAENAILKAKHYARLTNLPTIADDGGLVITYLNNEPGVKSRRWLGYAATDEELIRHTLTKLKGRKDRERKAYLETCICFFDPKTQKILLEKEKIMGQIAEKPYKNYLSGFPYRALFLVDNLNAYYDELTPEQHSQVNHRLIALNRLVKRIKDYLLK